MKTWTRQVCSKCGRKCLVEESWLHVGQPAYEPVVCAFCPQGKYTGSSGQWIARFGMSNHVSVGRGVRKCSIKFI